MPIFKCAKKDIDLDAFIQAVSKFILFADEQAHDSVGGHASQSHVFTGRSVGCHVGNDGNVRMLLVNCLRNRGRHFFVEG